MRFYDSAEEVRRRLQNGLIFYKGEPVWVVDYALVKGTKAKYGVTIQGLPLRDRSWKVSLEDPDLNYKHFTTGFVNCQGVVYRVLRYPHRGVKQSLDDHNCSLETIVGDQLRRPRLGEHSITSFTGLILQKDALESLAGKFPSMLDARKEVESGNAKSMAFHHNWAYQKIMGVPALWYKSRPVGLSVDPKSILKLEDRLAYLREPLEEIGIKVSS